MNTLLNNAIGNDFGCLVKLGIYFRIGLFPLSQTSQLNSFSASHVSVSSPPSARSVPEPPVSLSSPALQAVGHLLSHHLFGHLQSHPTVGHFQNRRQLHLHYFQSWQSRDQHRQSHCLLFCCHILRYLRRIKYL